MAGMDYSSLGGIIKRYYDKNLIHDQMNEQMYLWENIKAAGEKPVGEGFYFPARFARNQGGGAQTEHEALKEAGAQVVKQAKVLPKILTWTVQITGLAQAMASGEPGSFVNILDDSFNDALQAARMDLDRQFYGAGTGVVGTVTASTTSATQPVSNAAMFAPGAKYDRYSAAHAYQDTIECQDVNLFTNQVIFTASVATTTADYFVRQNVKVGAPADGKEFMGLRGIMDDGSVVDNFQGILRASGTYYILWRGLVIDASSTDLTADLLRRALDRVQMMGAKQPVILSNYGQRRKYLTLVAPQRRFMDGKFDAGYSALEFDGKPWLVADRCPRNTVICPNFDQILKFMVQDLALDDTGGTLKPLTGYDVAYAYYKIYGNLGTKQPNAAGIWMHSLNEPAAY